MQPQSATKDAVAFLRNAKERRHPWHEIAATLAALQSRSPTTPEGEDWVVEACRLTGYSGSQLWRMLRIRAFLFSVKDKKQVTAPRPEGRGFQERVER